MYLRIIYWICLIPRLLECRNQKPCAEISDDIKRKIRMYSLQQTIPCLAYHNNTHTHTHTSTGDQFLLYDNQRRDRMLIFGTQRFVDYCEHWFMDGTISSAPLQFAQLYTIHGYRQASNIVCAYALLPNKAANTYVEF